MNYCELTIFMTKHVFVRVAGFPIPVRRLKATIWACRLTESKNEQFIAGLSISTHAYTTVLKNKNMGFSGDLPLTRRRGMRYVWILFPDPVSDCEQISLARQNCFSDNMATTVYQWRFYQLAGLFHKPSTPAVLAGFILYHMAITDRQDICRPASAGGGRRSESTGHGKSRWFMAKKREQGNTFGRYKHTVCFLCPVVYR